jgi:hypothetical protein
MARRQITTWSLAALMALACAQTACGGDAPVAARGSHQTSTRGGMPATDGLVRTLEGTVVDRAAAGYLYLEVEGDDGQRVWVVSLMKDIAVGQRVRVHSLGARREFTAKKLQRTFSELWFAVVNPVPSSPA